MTEENKKTEEDLDKKPKTSKKEGKKGNFMSKAEMAIARKVFLRPPEEGELNI